MLVAANIVVFDVPARAAGESLSNPTTKSTTVNTALAIDDLQVTGSGDDSVSLSIHTTAGFLTIANEAATVTGNGSSTVVINGARSAVNTSLASLEYESDEIGTATVTADLGNNVGNVLWNDGPGGNGHAYIVVNNPLAWENARVAAEGYTFGGQSGYLATITNAQENNFVYTALNQQTGWIGANDVASEGNWGWRTGPETGTQFWNGNFSGTPVGGQYNNWDSPDEPNNSDGDEDCAQFWDAGRWNDLNCATARPFVVEFGDGETSLAPIQREFTIATTAHVRTITTCDELFELTFDNYRDTINLANDIDCQNSEREPLFQVFGIEGGEMFEGVFNGNGHTIKNVKLVPEWNMEGVALISAARGATIQDLTLDSITAAGNEYVGALSGWIQDTTITNVHILKSKVESQDGYIGGLVGQVSGFGGQSTVIRQSSVEGGSVVSHGNNVGGLIGQVDVMNNSTFLVEQTFTDIPVSSATTSSGADTGGLIGELTSGEDAGGSTTVTIQDAYSWGSVNVADGENIGGLIGRVGAEAENDGSQSNITIQRTYAKGSVTGSNEAGGLIGQLSEIEHAGASYVLSHNFAMGKVAITEADVVYEGGLIGRNETFAEQITAADNHWDVARSTQSECTVEDQDITADPLAGCSGINVDGQASRYYFDNTTNAPLNAWDFETIWVANKNITPTFRPVTSLDADGVVDEIENAAPNGGDGNNDGIPDSQQNNVASVLSVANQQYVTLAIDPSCQLSNVSSVNEASNTVKDGAYDYKGGFLNFTTTDCATDTVAVSLFYHGVVRSELIVRKYNPTTGAYFTITNANVTDLASPLSGTHVAYTITDNGILDTDPTAGVITDPVGLGRLVVGVPNTGLGGSSHR